MLPNRVPLLLFADSTCSPTAFTCANKRCVPAAWRCDGHNDCFDNSDESRCPAPVPGTCPANQFTCSNHRCIPHSWRCDTDNDCGDGSDEADCREYPPKEFSNLEWIHNKSEDAISDGLRIYRNCCLVICGRTGEHVSSGTVSVSRPPLHRPQLCVWWGQRLRGWGWWARMQWVLSFSALSFVSHL